MSDSVADDAPGAEVPARPPRSRWFALVWLTPAALAAAAIVVLVARWLREQPAIQDFIAAYPGVATLPADAPIGIPAWLNWQHFLSALFLVLIVRTGLVLRQRTRPAITWTRRNTGRIRTKGAPRRIGLDLWLHLSIDALWVLNGVVYVVLLFATGQWMRMVPTSWDVVPHAVSVGIQYASLDWPTENGWVAYNALQLLAYFATVFIAAPLAILTGLRLSPAWPHGATRLNRVYPDRLARAIHYPVLLYFVLFTIAHVTLVLATGALRNLNHMYAARDDASWVGAVLFGVSLVVMVAAVLAARPAILKPIAARFGKVTG